MELAILASYQHQNQCMYRDYFNKRNHNIVWRHISRQKIKMIQNQRLSLIWAISTIQWCYIGVLGMVLKLLTNPVTFWQCLSSIRSHHNLPCILITFYLENLKQRMCLLQSVNIPMLISFKKNRHVPRILFCIFYCFRKKKKNRYVVLMYCNFF